MCVDEALKEEVQKMSVRELKGYLNKHKVDYKGVLEKSEMRRLVLQHKASAQHTHATAGSPDLETKSVDADSNAIIKTIPVGPLQCNMTIVADKSTKKGILVDPGGDADIILDTLKKLGVTITQILVTHGHLDHFLAAEEVRAATKAPVFLHPDDTQLWNLLPVQCALLGIQAAKPISAPDKQLQDKQMLDVFEGLCIHTPGHSAGSTCFYFEPLKLLLSGDTLFAGSVGRTDLPGGNMQQLASSIRNKLFTLPADTKVIPGHGPSTNIGHERKFNAVIRSNV